MILFPKGDPPEYTNLYVIPGAAVLGGYAAAKMAGYTDIDQMAYLASSLCCVGALGGLSTQTSSRQGNALGKLINLLRVLRELCVLVTCKCTLFCRQCLKSRLNAYIFSVIKPSHIQITDTKSRSQRTTSCVTELVGLLQINWIKFCSEQNLLLVVSPPLLLFENPFSQICRHRHCVRAQNQCGCNDFV